MLSRAARLIERCAPGKSVKVVTKQGEFSLPEQPPAPKLEESVVEERESLAVREAVQSVNAAVLEVKTAIESLAQFQTRVAEELIAVKSAMILPVKPVYDSKGKFLGAKRVEKL